MGPCLAAAGAPSAGGPDPEGAGLGGDGLIPQPPDGPTPVCSADSQDVSSTAWVMEVDHLMNYEAVGDPLARAAGGVDPRVVQLDDGSYRMYFARMNVIVGLSTALSWDGVNWELEAAGVLPAGLPHTSLLRLPDGGWRLYTVQQHEGGMSHVLSFTSPDGLAFTQDPGIRLTDDDFPGGGLQSPSVVEAPGGGYRIYLSMAPAGEVVGQEGGNSTVWMVGATSDDMLSWSADPAVMVEGPLHPHVMVGDDGTYTVYGGMRLDRWTSMDGRAFSDPESFDLVGMDFHVLPLPDGQLRVIKSGSGATALTGASMEIWRSLDVTWDVDFGIGQWDQQDNFIISLCVNGWASSPVEIQLMDSRKGYGPASRWIDLEELAITVREGFPPFESTITLSSMGAPGTQEIESVVRVTQGTAGRDWHVIEDLMN